MVDTQVERQTPRPARRWHWAWLFWLLVPPLLWLVIRQVPLDQVLSALSRLSGGEIAVLVQLGRKG